MLLGDRGNLLFNNDKKNVHKCMDCYFGYLLDPIVLNCWFHNSVVPSGKNAHSNKIY